MEFRWNAWNIDHIGEHGISPEAVEYIIENAGSHYPIKRPDEKWLVWGQTAAGDYLQVIYLISPPPDVIYVIHARFLTDIEKRRYRRRLK